MGEFMGLGAGARRLASDAFGGLGRFSQIYECYLYLRTNLGQAEKVGFEFGPLRWIRACPHAVGQCPLYPQ